MNEIINDEWLKTHKWMIRSSNNGGSYCGFKWPKIGVWIDCPDWNDKPECGGGFHGETYKYHGFCFQYRRVELVEYSGKAIPIEGNKVKVCRARIVAIGTDIPEVALNQCGYLIAHDGDVISPKTNEVWLVLSGTVSVTNQSGGNCSFYDNSKCKSVTNQSGGTIVIQK